MQRLTRGSSWCARSRPGRLALRTRCCARWLLHARPSRSAIRRATWKRWLACMLSPFGWRASWCSRSRTPRRRWTSCAPRTSQAPLFVAANAAKTTKPPWPPRSRRRENRRQPVEIDGVPVPGCLRVKDNRALLLPEVKQLFVQGKILVSMLRPSWVAASVLPQDKPASMLEVGAGRATKTILRCKARRSARGGRRSSRT